LVLEQGEATMKRSGATLVEVLVAIFIMAIGLLALLVLFPLGVLTMAQAVQDDRAANVAQNATALAVLQDVRHDPSLYAPPTAATPIDLFQNPLFGTPPASNIFLDAADDAAGYAVYVDPFGVASFPAPYKAWVGGQSLGGVRRSSVSYASGPVLQRLQWFSFHDDITFAEDGTPRQIALNTMERSNEFTWAYLLRRPRQGEPSVVELSVVVYNKRSLAPDKVGLAPEEQAFAAAYDTGRNAILVSWAAGAAATPAVRVGSWVMDTTPVQVSTTPLKYSQPHAYLYRVVGVTEVSDTAIELEVQTPLRGWAGGGGNGTVVVMEGVVDVFEKGTGWRP
jgi:type II secretory pathway pseudopilin PulG